MTSLGLRLRRIREREEVGVRELARRMDKAPSYVVKIEWGLIKATPPVVRAVVEALGLPAQERQQLIALAEIVSVEHHRVPRGQSEVRKMLVAIRAVERKTAVTRCLTLNVVPGLLQVPPYARELFRGGVPDAELDAVVTARLRRQAVLKDPSKRFSFILAEGALRIWPGPLDVRQQQLRYLEELAVKGRPDICVLPNPAPLLLSTGASFVVHDETLVTIDTVNGLVTLTDEDDVKAHRELFDRIRSDSSALAGDALAKFLCGVRQEHV